MKKTMVRILALMMVCTLLCACGNTKPAGSSVPQSFEQSESGKTEKYVYAIEVIMDTAVELCVDENGDVVAVHYLNEVARDALKDQEYAFLDVSRAQSVSAVLTAAKMSGVLESNSTIMLMVVNDPEGVFNDDLRECGREVETALEGLVSGCTVKLLMESDAGAPDTTQPGGEENVPTQNAPEEGGTVEPEPTDAEIPENIEGEG